MHRPTGRTNLRYYGWWIVGFSGLTIAMSGPGQTVGVSAFVDPMVASLGISKSQLSTAYLIATLMGALLVPRVGRLIDRRGVRSMLGVIALCFGFGLLAMSRVNGWVSLGVGFFGIRLFGQGSLTLVSTTSVALWFERRRGLAVGLSRAVGSGSLAIMPLILTAVIARVGWRSTWMIAALAVWLVLLPVAYWGVRDSPESVGLPLDGIAPIDGIDDHPTEPRGADWTRAEASRTLMFWALSAAVATVGFVATGLVFHQTALLGERGLSRIQAAANFLPQTIAAIGMTLLVGVLIDRIKPRLVVIASMSSIIVALMLVRIVAPGPRAFAYAMLLGGAGGAMSAIDGGLFPRYFGRRNIGAIRGTVFATAVGASALGPLALSVGFDRYGSFGPVLGWLILVPLVPIVLCFIARDPDASKLDSMRRRDEPIGQQDASGFL